MKITNKETKVSAEINSPFDGDEFIVTLRKLSPFERLIDKEFIVESFSLEDTKAMVSYLTGSPTAVISRLGAELDPSAKEYTLFTPFTGRLEIFNKF